MALRRVFVLVVSLLIESISEPVIAQVIYGFDKARDFNTMHPGPFTVQAGSFRSEQNARQLQTQLAPHINYPVRVHPWHQYFLVIIGPLPSPAVVRSIGYLQVNSIVKQQNIEVAPSTPQHKPALLQIQPTAIPLMNSQGNWFFRADGGLLRPTSLNDSMTVNNGSNYPPPANVDLFSTTIKQNQPLLAFAAGYRWHRDKYLVPAYSLALRYQHLFSQNIKGTIAQYSLAEFNNYTYRWGMRADVLSLYSKVNLAQYKRVMSYVDVGIGAAWNHATNYQETALPNVTPRISPAFSSHTQTQFAYNVGAGVDVLLTPQIIVSLGYAYQSFGHIESGLGQSTWAATKLNLGNFTVNTALVGVTYLIGNSGNEA